MTNVPTMERSDAVEKLLDLSDSDFEEIVSEDVKRGLARDVLESDLTLTERWVEVLQHFSQTALHSANDYKRSHPGHLQHERAHLWRINQFGRDVNAVLRYAKEVRSELRREAFNSPHGLEGGRKLAYDIVRKLIATQPDAFDELRHDLTPQERELADKLAIDARVLDP